MLCGLAFFSFWVLCDFQISLNPWLGCEEHVECAWAQELNGRQVLFKCGHGRYWYLRDWVLAQVQHVYPLQMILAHPCPFIWLANLLANEEIAHARVGHIVLGTSGDYLEFVQTQLQGCLAGIFGTSVAFFLSQVYASWLASSSFIFFVLPLVKISTCCTFRLHPLKRSRVLLAMLMVLLVPSWRHTLTF